MTTTTHLHRLAVAAVLAFALLAGPAAAQSVPPSEHNARWPREPASGPAPTATPIPAESGHDFVRDGKRGLGRDVPWRRSSAAGRQHEMATRDIGKLDQRAFDHRLLVGNQPLHHAWGSVKTCSHDLSKRKQ